MNTIERAYPAIQLVIVFQPIGDPEQECEVPLNTISKDERRGRPKREVSKRQDKNCSDF
jgi:hypothetical protein